MKHRGQLNGLWPGPWDANGTDAVSVRKLQLKDERSLPRDGWTDGGLEWWEKTKIAQGQVSAPEHCRQVTQRL